LKVRVSPFSGGLRIGADYFARRQALSADADAAARGRGRGRGPTGLVDTMADVANPGLDVTRVHPAIVVFFEDTARLELLIRSHWRFPFSLAWRIFRPVMRWIGQFVLPIDEGRVVTRVCGLHRATGSLPDARAVIREYVEDGGVMQVVSYATCEGRRAGRLMAVTFPLPGGHIAGFLRLDAIGADAEGRVAVELSSSGRAGDGAGVWFVLGRIAVRTPLGERMALWAPGMECAPAELDPAVFPGTTIVGRHVQRLFGVRMVTHDYWFRPLA
jgi:hypothetical protein